MKCEFETLYCEECVVQNAEWMTAEVHKSEPATVVRSKIVVGLFCPVRPSLTANKEHATYY